MVEVRTVSFFATAVLSHTLHCSLSINNVTVKLIFTELPSILGFIALVAWRGRKIAHSVSRLQVDINACKSSSSESLSDKGSAELKKSFDAVVFDVLKVTPEEYAGQITLMDVPVFKAIQPELLSRKDKATFEKLEYVMSKEDNYKRLRDYISSLKMTPCIPYLGVISRNRKAENRLLKYSYDAYSATSVVMVATDFGNIRENCVSDLVEVKLFQGLFG
ncbi:hypothetical protein AAES_17878 [Amazona aestiva]|uniref:Ras-GEF domain-containing protein n=1 Tax=Amazona aestiva TaxID=12930 RepID=A0A0Q3X8H9_AMAAE|nr:hypothetical protein AAES_17878 [Amazona aestiva]